MLTQYSRYIKSPMNYIGNKYRIMSILQEIFPPQLDTMLDLFCGGCDVVFNTPANKHFANDANWLVIGIFKEFQSIGVSKAIDKIDAYIYKWNLSKTNKESYEEFRSYYNKYREPIALYTLMCYSFNYQFRFNSDKQYNNPFGKNRSSFTSVMRSNLLALQDIISHVEFSDFDFRVLDFSIIGRNGLVYADPPYLLTCGSYNDGTRGFKGWGVQDERDLYGLLSDLDASGIRFALSNVTHHKGSENSILLSWVKKHDYIVHPINLNYDNCNYQSKNKANSTREVVITNY